MWGVAQAFGYTNLSSFSREFKATNGQRPWDVLRFAAQAIGPMQNDGSFDRASLSTSIGLDRLVPAPILP